MAGGDLPQGVLDRGRQLRRVADQGAQIATEGPAADEGGLGAEGEAVPRIGGIAAPQVDRVEDGIEARRRRHVLHERRLRQRLAGRFGGEQERRPVVEAVIVVGGVVDARR